MVEPSAIVEQAQTQGFLGFVGTPRVFGNTQLKPDDVKYVAGEVGHDEGVKSLLVRNLDIPIKSMQFLADIITVTPSINNILLYQNQFPQEGAKTLSEALAHNSTVTKLNIGMNYFPLSYICKGIASCKSLTKLDLSYFEMSVGNALDDFINAMKNNTTITKMVLFSNNFNEQHGTKIGIMINTLQSLKTIDISFNDFGDEGLSDICQELKSNTQLECLTAGATGLTSACGKAVEELLLENSTLTYLNLIDNKIGKDGAIHIANALKVNTTLTHLNLNKNCLGFEGYCALAAGIKNNHGIKSLNLTRIIQTLPAVQNVNERQNIFDMIVNNQSLTSLNVGINVLGEDLICTICNGVSVGKNLTSLNLQRIKIDTDRASDAICRMIENNNSLVSLSFAYSRFSERVWPQFFNSLKKNSCLMDLNLRCTLNKSERILLLRDYLCDNPCLQSINLGDNNIRLEDCNTIADIIRNNSTLTSMILDSNCVKPEGGKILINALEQNYTLVELFHQNSYIGVEMFNKMEELFARNKRVFKPGLETFLYGICCDKSSPVSLLHDIPVISKFISCLAIPEWHSQNIVDQVFDE